MSELIHDKEKNRFILKENDYTAKIDYVTKNDTLYLVHSEVPYNLRGQGIGKQLVEKTFEYIEQNNLKAVSICSYIKSVAKRNPRWSNFIQ